MAISSSDSCLNGGISVVKRPVLLHMGICQNPLFASSLLKIVAPDSCARDHLPLVMDASPAGHSHLEVSSVYIYFP